MRSETRRKARVWIPGATLGETVELAAADARHVARVLRRGPGDEIEILGADGQRFFGRIVDVRETEGDLCVQVCVEAEASGLAPRLIPWTVAAALVKERGFDLAVRYASELGLEALIPLVAERSQVKLERSGKPERWERVAREAAKQCGRSPPLAVGGAVTLGELLERWPAAGKIWLLSPGGRPPLLAELAGEGPALFVVGPEGGFSPAEEALASARGGERLGLPTPILRTPTAVVLVAALGVLCTLAARPDGGLVPDYGVDPGRELV